MGTYPNDPLYAVTNQLELRKGCIITLIRKTIGGGAMTPPLDSSMN
jgi:hypothetical protein